LRLKLADVYAADIRDINLVSLDFDTFDVLQLGKSPSLPQILLHLSYVLNK
jgi:hypothetical protein